MANSPSIGSTGIKVGHVLTNDTEINNLSIENGRIYLCTDSGTLWYDWNNQRKQILADFLSSINGRLYNFNTSIANMNEVITELKDSIGDMTYAPLEISNFASSIKYLELGNSTNSVTLSWNLNRDPASQSINGSEVSIGLRSQRLTNTYNATTPSSVTWTLTVVDKGGTSTSATCNMICCNGIYYGVNSSTSYNSDLISSLSKTLSNSKSRTLTFNAGNNQFIYYCIPSRLGTPEFYVGGFTGGFTKVATIPFTNNYSYRENYDIWKSDNPNLGSVSISIS